MILFLHNNSHVGVVWDLPQWSVYTCERTACNCCRKEEIPAEIGMMAKAFTAPSARTSLAAPRANETGGYVFYNRNDDLPHQGLPYQSVR
jgi:hypothetical protein